MKKYCVLYCMRLNCQNLRENITKIKKILKLPQIIHFQTKQEETLSDINRMLLAPNKRSSSSM